MPVVSIIESLKAGVLSDISDMWRKEYPVLKKQQDVLLKFLKSSTIRNATYPFKESLPFPKPWPYGKGRTLQTFKDRSIAVGIVPYELSVPWSVWDEKDDQLSELKTHVQQATKRFMMLPDVLIGEYFNGTVDLNPSLYNAYDGVSIFSATDGDGANRFGVSGGNIISSGSGLTVAGVVHDLTLAQQRLLQFQDPTAGKPIFSEDEATYKNLVVIAPVQANEVFQKASQSEYIRTDLGNNTSESNFVKGTFEYHLNPYLTDTNDWFVVMKHSHYKPFMYRGPQDQQDIVADINNSDAARATNEYILHSSLRVRLAPFFPACIIKITN